jgi:hypothetical protein
MTWRLHIGTIEAKAFRTFIRTHPLFRSERLSANIKLTLHKALIRSAVTYVCPALEFAAETRPLKLQRVQNKSSPRHWQFSKEHTDSRYARSFTIPYVYVTKLCRRQSEIIHNHENENVRNIGQGETPHRKYMRLKLDGGHLYGVQVSRLLWQCELLLVGHKLLYWAWTDRGLRYSVCTRICMLNICNVNTYICTDNRQTRPLVREGAPQTRVPWNAGKLSSGLTSSGLSSSAQLHIVS